MSALLTASGTHSPRLELWLVDLDSIAEAASAAVGDLGVAAVLPHAMGAGGPRRRTAHIALRALLLQRLDPAIALRPFAPRPHGKPAIPGADLELSLSHSGAHALIALSREGTVGVDIEAPRAMPMSVARREAIERAGVLVGGGSPLAGETDEARALSAWVRLEAAAKATGEGIGRLLTRLGVRPGRAPVESCELGMLPCVYDLDLPGGLLGAVALVGDATTLRAAVPTVSTFTIEQFALASARR